jgi:hypothetical protein
LHKNTVDLTGQRFSRLVVVADTGHRAGKKRQMTWLCRCDCGKLTLIQSRHLVGGSTKSCGCFRRDFMNTARNKKKPKHGYARRKGPGPLAEYRCWLAMKSRCFNKAQIGFKNYGARGITVCDEWKHNFEAFLAYIGHKPTPEHSIDRIDNDRGYEPGNVRWADRHTQNKNQRRRKSNAAHA